MADDALPVQSGILDPLVGAGFFSPNMSLEEIKRRRAIGAALASRARPFPKTIGEGMTALGEAFGERLAENRLVEAEKGYDERFAKDAAPLRARIGGSDTVTPPVATPAPAVVRPPAPVGAVTAVDPLTVEPASGPANRDVIARGILARNGVVPPDPTVTAGSPPPISPLAGSGPLVSRPAALEGASFAEEGGSNPPTVSRDIRPMVMAQARTGAPPAAPVQPAATPGGTLEPVIPEALPDRLPPVKDERMSQTEKDAWLFWQKTRDPRAEDMFRQAHELGKAARDARFNQEKADHDKYVAQQIARETVRQNAITNRDANRLELQTKAAGATEAQAKEAARLTYGNLPEPVQKTLEASKEKAALSSSAIEAVNNAREAQKYAVSGTGADWQLQWYRLKAKAGDKEAQRVVQASETYKANLVPIMQTMLKSLAGKDISTKELEFIRSVSGADLSLDKSSADRMLAIAERVAKQDVQSHRDTVETMIKGQPESAHPALRKVYDVREPLGGVPLSEANSYKEGDIARGKPGQPDLVRRGGKWVPM